mgnify:CR=1 FL=1
MKMTACPTCRLDLLKVDIGGAVSFCPRYGNRLSSDFDDKTLPLDNPFSRQRLEVQAAIIDEALSKSKLAVSNRTVDIQPDDGRPTYGAQALSSVHIACHL